MSTSRKRVFSFITIPPPRLVWKSLCMEFHIAALLLLLQTSLPISFHNEAVLRKVSRRRQRMSAQTGAVHPAVPSGAKTILSAHSSRKENTTNSGMHECAEMNETSKGHETHSGMHDNERGTQSNSNSFRTFPNDFWSTFTITANMYMSSNFGELLRAFRT